jgi:CRP-like cAMP-binding protein
MYVVQEGVVEMSIRGLPVSIAEPGDAFGEMALLEDTARSATAVAKVDCKLVPISAKRFLALIQHTPNFALQIMRIMSERLRQKDAATIAG